jgi:tetratricopeptide (TPR) repeat protein
MRGYLALGRLADAEGLAGRVRAVKDPPPELSRTCALTAALVQRRESVRKGTEIPAGKAMVWNRAIDSFVCAEYAASEGRPGSQVEALLQPALKEGVELGPAQALRGRLFLDRGRLGSALADAERAITRSPREALGYYVRGRVRLERDQDGALANLARAVELSGRTDAVLLHWLAAALEQAGRGDEALAAQRQAVQLRPHDPELADQLRRLEKALGKSSAGR